MNLQEEIISLRCWGGPRDTFGDRIVFAFGRTGNDAIGNAPEYDFTITLSEGVLTASIDIYTAEARYLERRLFDVDEWTDRQLQLEVVADREGYRELARIARAIIGGRDVNLPGGIVIPCVKKVQQ